MKKYLAGVKFAALAIILAAATSCQFDIKSIEGSGQVTTETRNPGRFTKVNADKGLDIVIEMSDSPSVIVEADDNVQKHIITRVEGDVLVITSDYNSYRNVTKKVTVKMNEITGLETGSGVSMRSSNVLKGTDMMLKSASGSSMEINAESDHISAEASSGSHITLRGKAISLETDSSSGSEIEARDLMVNDVTSRTSSGSSTSVQPILKLDAKASSGSSISYFGTPKTITRNESSGGSVEGH